MSLEVSAKLSKVGVSAATSYYQNACNAYIKDHNIEERISTSSFTLKTSMGYGVYEPWEIYRWWWWGWWWWYRWVVLCCVVTGMAATLCSKVVVATHGCYGDSSLIVKTWPCFYIIDNLIFVLLFGSHTRFNGLAFIIRRQRNNKI